MRMIRRAIAALAVGAFALALAVSGVSAKSTADAWETSDIMKKLNNKTKGAIAKATAAVKDGKWEDAAKMSETLKHGEDLAKNKQNKGDKESWDKLTKAYGENTKAMVSAIDKKDKDAFEKAAKGVGPASCKACHDAHK